MQVLNCLQETLRVLEEQNIRASPSLSQLKNNFCWWDRLVARFPNQTYRLPNLSLYLTFKPLLADLH